jgi:hypothetical protein
LAITTSGADGAGLLGGAAITVREGGAAAAGAGPRVGGVAVDPGADPPARSGDRVTAAITQAALVFCRRVADAYALAASGTL